MRVCMCVRCVYVIAHACGHLWVRVWVPAPGCLSRRKGRGRCARLDVTTVTKELKQAGTRRGTLLGGVLRADAGSVGGGGRRAVRVAPEPKRVAVRLGRQRVCARGACGGREVAAVSTLRVRALSRSISSSRRPPGCLSGRSSQRPSYLPAHSPAECQFPRARGSGEAERKSLRTLGLSLSTAPLAVALERDCEWGVLGGLLPRGKSTPSPPQTSFPARLGRARTAAGEAGGLAAPRHPPLAGAPHPAATAGPEKAARPGRDGRGLARRVGRGRCRPGGGARGRGPRHPGTFPRQGPGAGPPPSRQLRGPHVVADVTPTPHTHTLHPD